MSLRIDARSFWVLKLHLVLSRGYAVFAYLLYFSLFFLACFFAGNMVSIYGVVFSIGTVIFAMMFLLTDVIRWNYGKKASLNLIKSLILSICIIDIAAFFLKLNDISFFRAIAVSTLIIPFSSMLDFFIFERLIKKGKFIVNNVSTITAQALDSTLFFLLFFWGKDFPISALFIDITVRCIIAIFDTPFFLFFTRKKSIINKK